MRKTDKEKKYLLSGRHGFFYSSFFFLLIVFFSFTVIVAAVLYINKIRSSVPSVSSLYTDWNANDFLSVYENSELILIKHPLDGAVLAMHGFAAYYLYSEQNDPSLAQTYLVSSINSLRNAWYRVTESEKPQIAYILGKAYYQKGFYYADLAIKYLDYVNNSGVKFDDLTEFLGLSASLLGDYEKSIAAFTEALAIKPSDLLLYTLSQNYLQVNDNDKAKQYLYETIRTTKDELLQLKCHNTLGNIFLSNKEYANAQIEFNTILEKDSNFADAHYGLGVIYENQGDLIRARAEWRKALSINPVHAGARLKLNM